MAHTSGKIIGARSAFASVTASARGTLTGRAATDAATRASRSVVMAATLGVCESPRGAQRRSAADRRHRLALP
jgi:hypothetical protein